MMRCFLILIILMFYIISPCSGYASEEYIEIIFDAPDKKGIPRGWKMKERTGHAEFRLIQEEGDNVIYLKSNAASFSFEKNITIDPKKYPFINWRWKVLKLPEGGDVRLKSKNDQAAQILILFEGGKTISYVWDTEAPEGTIMDESVGWPINIKIKVMVVKRVQRILING